MRYTNKVYDHREDAVIGKDEEGFAEEVILNLIFQRWVDFSKPECWERHSRLKEQRKGNLRGMENACCVHVVEWGGCWERMLERKLEHSEGHANVGKDHSALRDRELHNWLPIFFPSCFSCCSHLLLHVCQWSGVCGLLFIAWISLRSCTSVPFCYWLPWVIFHLSY